MIVLGDDYASNLGPLMSPALFEQFILPRLQRMIDMIHEEGALCIKHSDGNLYPLTRHDRLAEPGRDQSDRAGCRHGTETKSRDWSATRSVFRQYRLRSFAAARIARMRSRDAVAKAIADAGSGGGYILSSSNSIHSSCCPRNLVAMVEGGPGVWGLSAEGGLEWSRLPNKTDWNQPWEEPKRSCVQANTRWAAGS